MKKLLAIALFGILGGNSFAQIKFPQPSPFQTITQDFGMGKIELSYYRPSAKGRKVMGDLVPYDKMWRTGANGSTLIKFTEPVEIMGNKLDTGTYALYTVPGKKTWEIILNKGNKNWGLDGYKSEEDVARFQITPNKSKQMTETFSFQFSNMKAESCTLLMSWENTEIAIPINASFRDKLRSQLEEALKNAEKKPYWQAAQFYNEYDKNYGKALEYAGKALEINGKAYWIALYKAKIEKEMGMKAEALASARKAKDLAKEGENDDYVKMAEELIKELE
jgi:tetratricopeptide (TPR) repeat protein